MFLGFLIFSILFFNFSQADVFTCTDANTGNLPSNVNSVTTVPKGTNCTFSISTATGYAVRFTITSQSSNVNDTVIFTHTNGDRYLMPSTNSISQISTTGVTTIQIVGFSGASTFFANYTYFPITGYTPKTTINTGEAFQLSLTVNSYYTISSTKNETIISSVAKVATAAIDNVLDQIFVFDGADIVNSKFLGRLSHVADAAVSSTSSEITLVNFFNTVSTNYFLANDASTVSKFNKYSVLRMSSEGALSGNLTDYSTAGSAYTFICTDCDTFYLGRLVFNNFATITNLAFISFSGMTPTHRLPTLLNYTAMQFTDDSLPQIIPSNVFTMYTYMSGIHIGISTQNTWKNFWQSPYVGRKGFMMNPSLWKPTASPSFSYTINNQSSLYTFSLTPSNLAFTSDSDSLQVSLLNSAGVTTLQKKYSRGDAISTFSGIGNGINVQLSTGKDANVQMSFDIKEGKSSSALTLFTTFIVLFYKLLL